MNCPDIDQLIDYHQDRSEHRALDSHVEGCQECQATLRTFEAVESAFLPEREVPERLVRAVVENLPPPNSMPVVKWMSPLQVTLSGVLGASTALLSVLVSGLIGAAGTVGLILTPIGGALVGVGLSLGYAWRTPRVQP